MTADIVERLREFGATANPGGIYEGLPFEAADEIEQLRNTIKNCPPVSESEYVRRLEDEIERLREILRIIWVAYQDNDGIRKIFHEGKLHEHC